MHPKSLTPSHPTYSLIPSALPLTTTSAIGKIELVLTTYDKGDEHPNWADRKDITIKGVVRYIVFKLPNENHWRSWRQASEERQGPSSNGNVVLIVQDRKVPELGDPLRRFKRATTPPLLLQRKIGRRKKRPRPVPLRMFRGIAGN
ncbi:hypothetical protein J6590_015338 [Homalodisca vitripennis]|nr:hypothetical protein J6590_015338 [Homalodisca vitripennis]